LRRIPGKRPKNVELLDLAWTPRKSELEKLLSEREIYLILRKDDEATAS
jgi:hypothetical protein